MSHTLRRRAVAVALTAVAAGLYVTPASAWEPTRNVEFIVPAGTGGGADQMARAVQGIVAHLGQHLAQLLHHPALAAVEEGDAFGQPFDRHGLFLKRADAR